jgi:hypothetical protein
VGARHRRLLGLRRLAHPRPRGAVRTHTPSYRPVSPPSHTLREKTKPRPTLTHQHSPSRRVCVSDPNSRAVALTAVVTDHWIVPTGSALPFVSHAGLWKVCFTAAATQADGELILIRVYFSHRTGNLTGLTICFV